MTTQLLSDDDLGAINKALDAIERLRPELARAKLAEIDVADREARLDEQERKLRATKNAFFPNR